MLIKSLKSGNHYQFITLFVVCATGRSCLLFNNIVPFDNKDSAKTVSYTHLTLPTILRV